MRLLGNIGDKVTEICKNINKLLFLFYVIKIDIRLEIHELPNRPP